MDIENSKIAICYYYSTAYVSLSGQIQIQKKREKI